MPEKIGYADWVLKRAEWVAERDKKDNGPVPKGAAKVSLGDALDKFHKAADKGAKDGYPAGLELKKVVETYKEAVKAKYPKIVDVITKKIEKHVNGYLEQAKKAVEYAGKYGDLREKVGAQMIVVGAEFMQWEKGPKAAKFKPTNATAAKAALNAFLGAVQGARFCTDKIAVNDSKVYAAAVLAIDGDAWEKVNVEKCINFIKATPNSL